MAQSAAIRITYAAEAAPAPGPGNLAAPPESQPLEAAATLACRTPVGADTLGADAKAAGVLTLLGIMFTVLARFGPELTDLLHGGGFLRFACATLAAGFVLCAVAAIVQAFRTISPRFCRAKPSLAFFAEIARLDQDEYAKRVEAMTMEDAVGEILSYNHTAATICAEKYRQLRRALRCFECAAACWLLLAVVLLAASIAV